MRTVFVILEEETRLQIFGMCTEFCVSAVPSQYASSLQMVVLSPSPDNCMERQVGGAVKAERSEPKGSLDCIDHLPYFRSEGGGETSSIRGCRLDAILP